MAASPSNDVDEVGLPDVQMLLGRAQHDDLVVLALLTYRPYFAC